MEPGAVRAIQLNFALQSLYQHADQLETQCFGFPKIHLSRKSNPVVFQLQNQALRAFLTKLNSNFSALLGTKCVFQGVGNQLIDNQSARNLRIHIQWDLVEF